LYINVSKDDEKIAVALGKKLIKGHIQITEIAVYSKDMTGKFTLEHLKEFQYPDACMRFEFNAKNNNQLYFFTSSKLFMIDVTDESIYKTVYKYKSPLKS